MCQHSETTYNKNESPKPSRSSLRAASVVISTKSSKSYAENLALLVKWNKQNDEDVDTLYLSPSERILKVFLIFGEDSLEDEHYAD